MTIYERLLLPENLIYAWRKAKNLYRTSDGYIDRAELANFELNLEQNLILIRKRFARGSWRLRTLRPLPRPKKLSEGRPLNRQYYHVAVEDQVAWIAIANAIGPNIDQQMPAWSYGNRLYRPAWYEETEGQQSVLEIGPYRHASGRLFRKFQHSWPLFRRHVALTARTMAQTLDLPSEWEELDQGERLAVATARRDGLHYLTSDFWVAGRSLARGTRLFHASFDLKQFFPSIRAEAVLNGIVSSMLERDERLERLLDQMLRFRIDTTGIDPRYLTNVEPDYHRNRVHGIPTGLFVAGFLANVAMLKLDLEIDQIIANNRSIAHFRYVDDHTIIAFDFDELSSWISCYQDRLLKHGTGASVNPEKYDPASLTDWLNIRAESTKSTRTSVNAGQRRYDEARRVAIAEADFDGGNPTTLLTKTLGQISAIASESIDILDDQDLRQRLNKLEWLLLANIPDREIRPETRAAFAAGRIAELAPILVREPQDLVEASRLLSTLINDAPRTNAATDKELEEYTSIVDSKKGEVERLRKDFTSEEEHHLRHCFRLLFQAFQEYPEKSRLFYRILEYCRVTGYNGFNQVARWIRQTRENNNPVWADYYAGLSLQILAHDLLVAARTTVNSHALQSATLAARHYLEHVSQIEIKHYCVLREYEAWFHAKSRYEFGVAALSVAESIREHHFPANVQVGLKAQAEECLGLSFASEVGDWVAQTGWQPGTWAHLVECSLSSDDLPSVAWRRFIDIFSFSEMQDLRAVRRYPESLPDAAWDEMIRSDEPVPESESGWLRDAMDGNDARITAATFSKRLAFRRAAKSFTAPSKGWITVVKWTELLRQDVSPFDPRRSEWTALEIIRQVISPIVSTLGVDERYFDRLHPVNVLVPESWITDFHCNRLGAAVGWEEWRQAARSKRAKPRDSASSVKDYRCSSEMQGSPLLSNWERRLIGVGRLLLGLLRLNHDGLRIWNIRGNEQVVIAPRSNWIQSLAISSRTLLLIDACLSARSKETRTIKLVPKLFGWTDGLEPNDLEFDPPSLIGTNELLSFIEEAQRVLEENQLAVGMNQPRQLIPFRLVDFAAGRVNEQSEDVIGE